MTTSINSHTCNIRIPKQTHEQIKNKCKREGRLMGAYVNTILCKTIIEDKEAGEPQLDSNPGT